MSQLRASGVCQGACAECESLLDLLALLSFQPNVATGVGSGEPAGKPPCRIRRSSKSYHFKPLNLGFVSFTATDK